MHSKSMPHINLNLKDTTVLSLNKLRQLLYKMKFESLQMGGGT